MSFAGRILQRASVPAARAQRRSSLLPCFSSSSSSSQYQPKVDVRSLTANHNDDRSSMTDHIIHQEAVDGRSPNNDSLVIDVSPLAHSIRQQVRDYASQLQTQQKDTAASPLHLVGILAGDPNACTAALDAELYSQRIQDTLLTDGVHYTVWRTTTTPKSGQAVNYQKTLQSEVETLIQQANRDDSVHGILVFYPIFAHQTTTTNADSKSSSNKNSHHNSSNNSNNVTKGPYKNVLTGVYYKTHDDYFRDLVVPHKDVEGLCGTHRWYHRHHHARTSTTTTTTPFASKNSHRGNKKDNKMYPCTAKSVQQILETYHLNKKRNGLEQAQTTTPGLGKKNEDDPTLIQQPWHGQVVSIVNRSEIVGRPLAAMLAQLGATVYSIDQHSILRFTPPSPPQTKKKSSNSKLHRCCPSHHTMASCLQKSQVIVTGVPCPTFSLPLDHIPYGATVVNVSEFQNVPTEQLMILRPDVQYIPQVGKVTVSILEQNLMQLHMQQQQEEEDDVMVEGVSEA